MKHFILFISFLIISVIGISQNKATQKLRAGDKIVTNFPFYKDIGKPDNFEIPLKPKPALLLIYRFGKINGIKDNHDSVYKVVNHIYRLNRYFGPLRKPSRLTCYIYVDEVNQDAITLKNQINIWTKEIGDSLVKTERAGFNFTRPWQVLFIKETETKKEEILNLAKLTVVAADGELMYSTPIASFKFNGKKGSVKGKLLTEKEGKKMPIHNAMVTMIRVGMPPTDSVLTDVYGDFELDLDDDESQYSVVVRSNSTSADNIILATQAGQEISRLNKTERGFEYKLIPNDIVLLTEKETDDISLIFSKFGGSKETDLKVSENILYGLGEFKVTDSESKKILDKVVKILKENPKVTLQVISHTDAQGDDTFNMNLSEKRSASVISYFVSKGVDTKRLKAIGKGETEIRNRCGNDVDCSDAEHEFNRRTEFKFTKG
ncbi:OmpA family protein [Aurantibacillus circumpalustris]|uniref:OmpA family protein n=1 Tax=Aurantibacillus circumpalustris TaxID=3036359 RepID=UPI00295AA51D|nr:OmpA family protein [Aurantibacillus circumpalustris]